MGRHTHDDLKMLQSLPLEVKIRKTQQRIIEYYEYYGGDVYVSESGGKDSTVLSHIVKGLYPDVPNIFIDTKLEYSSVRKQGILLADHVLNTKYSIEQVILMSGYPIISKEVANMISGAKNDNTRMKRAKGVLVNNKTGELSQFNNSKYEFLLNAPFKISDKCCDIMKKKPSLDYEKQTGKKPILGLMASESKKRRDGWLKTGCNAFDKKRPQSQPMAFWTEQDVLQYIKLFGLEIASAYGEIVYVDMDGMEYDNDIFNLGMELITTGESRTGCTFCLFGITHDSDRFIRLKELEPKKYDYVMRGGKFDENGMWIPHKGLGYKFVIDWLNENGNLNIKY